jgi:curli biogenesis system outer membrane secretion channel CsgG
MRFLMLALVAVTLVSCKSAPRSHDAYRRDGPAMKPVVAVTDFENKASFSGQWNLGQGVADMLITRLIDSEKVVVLERKNLDDVVGEIVRQGQELFRTEGRVEKGRLKNAQYLVRGVITDFTVTGDASGWFGYSGLKVSGKSSKARVAVNVKVYEVASGEVVTSVKTDGEVSAGGAAADVKYKDLSLGGDAFFRTPLGEATDEALEKAVKKILKELPAQYWQPRIAEAGLDEVIINGGKNVKLKEGALFAVREAGRDITDPVTGNVIENVPGKVIGRIKVTSVGDASAHAVIVAGRATRGDYLEAGRQ